MDGIVKVEMDDIFFALFYTEYAKPKIKIRNIIFRNKSVIGVDSVDSILIDKSAPCDILVAKSYVNSLLLNIKCLVDG